MGEFLDTFSLLAHVRGGCQNGQVAYSDFLAYYEVVSSTVDNDSFFELLLNRVWSVAPTPSEGSTAAFAPPPRRRDGAGRDSDPRRPAVPVFDANDSPMKEPRPPAHNGPSTYA